jgi:hypothetical protein
MLCNFFTFGICFRAHIQSETRLKTRRPDIVAFVHLEIPKDSRDELRLVDHQEALGAAASNAAAEDPLGVAAVCDSEFVIDLGRCEVRFRF